MTSGGTTASNKFIIDITSDGTDQAVNFISTRILGQLTATDLIVRQHDIRASWSTY